MTEPPMSNETEQQLSALTDQELNSTEQQACLDALNDDVNLRQTWSRYHLVGQALRNELPDHVDLNLTHKIATAIAAEAPLNVGAEPARTSQPAAEPWWFSLWKPAGSLAVAASVAMLSVWVWNQSIETGAAAPHVLVNNQNAPAQSHQVVPVSTLLNQGMNWQTQQQQRNLATQRKLNNLFIHHAEHSAPLQGLIPQARVAGFDAPAPESE